MKKIICSLSFLLISVIGFSQGIKISDLPVLTTPLASNVIPIVNGGVTKQITYANFTSGFITTSGSYSNPSWITALTWSKITGTPTTIAGYGITDPIVLTSGSYSNPAWITALAWSKITGKPTSLSGYGITDGVGGSGTQNYITKWNNVGGTTIGNSVVFDNGTNVGIGTTSPVAKLHLTGTFRYVDGNQSNGYVLTTDASGNATWQAGGASGVSSVTGTTNRITSTGGTTPVIDIAATYVGQTSLTTLGTITTGTLGSGSKILVGSDATGDMYYNGGSGAITRLGAGATGSYLRGAGAATAPLWSTLILPNSATAGQVVRATSTNTYGGSANYTYTDAAGLALTMTAGTGAVAPLATYTDVAHTALTASTERHSMKFDLSANQTFAAGNITLNRSIVIDPPTYTISGGVSSIATGITMDITGPPAAGTLTTIGTPMCLRTNGTNEFLTSTATSKAKFGHNLIGNINGAATGYGIHFSRGDASYYSASMWIGVTNNYQLGFVANTGFGFYDVSASTVPIVKYIHAGTSGVQALFGKNASASEFGASQIVGIYDASTDNGGGTSFGVRCARSYSQTIVNTAAAISNESTTSSGTLSAVGLVVNTTGGTAANRYGVVVGSGQNNGFGLSTITSKYIPGTYPTALVHIGAGTATANTAPQKYTAGTLLTVIESLAKEVNANGTYQTNTALNRCAEGGVIKDFYTSVSNSGTSATDLYTYTTKANTLAADGEKLSATFAGTINLTTSGAMGVYFAGTNLLSGLTNLSTTSGSTSWDIEVLIIRTGATTARSTVKLSNPQNTTYSFVYSEQKDLTGLTLSGTNILKVTGTSDTGSSEITAKLGTIRWDGAANN